MKNLGYIFAKVLYKLKGNDKEVISSYFRKNGMKIGRGSNICCNIMTPEPFMIEIGNDVTIAGGVEFITHDNSISKVLENTTDLFGKIVIGNNCFLGARSTFLYGVELADNIIVAAGSVVTQSFSEERIIIGGNPARKISTWQAFGEKNRAYAWNLETESRETLLVNAEKMERIVKR